MTEIRDIKGVLFDVHDTLIIKDYRASREGLDHSVLALKEAGYEISMDDYELAWQRAAQAARRDAEALGEVSVEGWYRLIFSSLGLGEYGPELVQKVNNAWNEAFAKGTKALPWTKSVLRRLRPRYGLGIVSNSLALNTISDLRVAGILDFFETIVISSDLGRRKPHPLIFLAALEKMGLEPKQAVFVGDNPYEDILGAKNVGMKTVLINSPVVERARLRHRISIPKPEVTVEEPDATIREMKELPTLLEEWNMDWRTGSSHRELILTGRVVNGLGQGAEFTQLPWAREQFIEKLDVDPFPGTLNLVIDDPAQLESLQALWKEEGICIPPPDSNFCAAKGFRVMVADRFPGAIVFPLVPGYAQNTIEIISPVHLRSSLGAEEGSVVTVKVTL